MKTTEKPKEDKSRGHWGPEGMSLGMCFGLLAGTAMGVTIPLGMLAGLVLGTLLPKPGKEERK